MLLGTFSSLLNLPASTVAERNRMLYVEPAGGAPEIFSRGYKHLFFAQQATADHQGDVFAEYIAEPAARPSARRPPPTRRSTTRSRCRSSRASARSSRRRASRPSTTRSTRARHTNFDSIANAVKSANPDVLVHGATFDDGVNFVRALDKVGFKPKYFFQTSAPSFADQYSKGDRRREHRGVVLRGVVGREGARRRATRQFVKQFNQMFGAGEPAEDAADAFAAAQVHAGRRQGRRRHRRPDEARGLDPRALRRTRSSGR